MYVHMNASTNLSLQFNNSNISCKQCLVLKQGWIASLAIRSATFHMDAFRFVYLFT